MNQNSRWVAALVGAMVIAVAGCGSSRTGVAAGRADQTASSIAAASTNAPRTTELASTAAPTTQPPATQPPATQPAATQPPATTAAVTTTTHPPTTTTSRTTTAPTTTSPTTIAGWKASPPFDPNLLGPLDQSNWTGVVSPALPVAGQPLADGIYPAHAVTWDPAHPNSLGIEVERLDPCTSLPTDSCITSGDPFLPTELGINRATTINMTIPLDGSVGIGLIGFECAPVDALGNGADLAGLFGAFDSAYTSVIAPQLAAGVDPIVISAAIVANPTGGFSGAVVKCPDNGDSGLVFRSGNAPPILMQTLTGSTYDPATGTSTSPPLTPITATHLNTIQVIGGKISLLFYAGFFS